MVLPRYWHFMQASSPPARRTQWYGKYSQPHTLNCSLIGLSTVLGVSRSSYSSLGRSETGPGNATQGFQFRFRRACPFRQRGERAPVISPKRHPTRLISFKNFMWSGFPLCLLPSYRENKATQKFILRTAVPGKVMTASGKLPGKLTLEASRFF